MKKPHPSKISARALFSGIKNSRVIITFHSLGDADAAGSAIALFRALGRKCVIAPPDKPNSSARKLLELTATPTTLFSSIARSPSDIIIALDSSSPHLMYHLAGIQPDILIDHHARLGGEINGKKEICDPSASSTCEMLHFLLRTTDKLSCTALLAGIISDSAMFKSSTPRTFEAVAFLLEHSGLTWQQALTLLQVPSSFGERIEALRSCQSVSAEKIGSHIAAIALAKSHEAHFADMLVSLGADIAFVGCAGEDNHRASHDGAPLPEGKVGGRISARMRENLRGRVNLERIMFEAGKLLGGNGSGHELAAGASGSPQNLRAALGLCVKLSEQQLQSFESGKIKKIEW